MKIRLCLYEMGKKLSKLVTTPQSLNNISKSNVICIIQTFRRNWKFETFTEQWSSLRSWLKKLKITFSGARAKFNNLTKESFPSLMEWSLFLMENTISRKMVQLLVLHWVQLWLICYYDISKKNVCLIALLLINLFHIEDMLRYIFVVFVWITHSQIFKLHEFWT